MAYKIIYKKRFQNSLLNLSNYLEDEWGARITTAFLRLLFEKIATLQQQPLIGRKSDNVKNVRCILITHHNKLFYRIEKNKIAILDLKDTRINPTKTKY